MTSTIVLIIIILLVLVVGGFAAIFRLYLTRGKVRYTFISQQGEQVITNWKAFNKDEYDAIFGIYKEPDGVDYLITDHKGTEVILSVLFIIGGRIHLERK